MEFELRLFSNIYFMNRNLRHSQILSYRNGYYQGFIKNGVRDGPGIILLDQGPILVTNWSNDVPNGQAFAFVNSSEYAYLQFNQGTLNNYCYFCSEKEMFIVQFVNERPVGRQLLVNFYQRKVKILENHNGTYQIVEEMKLEERNQQKIVERYLGVKMSLPSLNDYLQNNFCQQNKGFDMSIIPNGHSFFKFTDQSSPLSLGFIITKKQQLVSYGHYIEGKLQGFGCKIDTNARYEGQFEAGLLHGVGLIISNGRYTLGQFQEGNLVEPIKIQEKSLTIMQTFKDLCKKQHIRCTYFENNFIQKDIINYKGISQTRSQSIPIQQQIYVKQVSQQPTSSSHLKGSNISLNKILSSRAHMKEENQFRATGGQIERGQRQWGENRRWDMGSSGFRGDPIKRFPFE